MAHFEFCEIRSVTHDRDSSSPVHVARARIWELNER